jgi:hypothetical protein
MTTHRIAWLPGGGIGGEIVELPEVVSGELGSEGECLGCDITMSVFPRETAPVVTPKRPPRPEEIRAAGSDVDGFQQFIQEGKHLC